MLRRWRAAWPRRGHFQPVVPAPSAAAPLGYLRQSSQRRSRPLPVRRGHYWQSPQPVPKLISGLLVWLDADQDAASGTGSVATAPDWSGQGNHASQATSGLRPTRVAGAINGHAVYRFDGTDDYLATAAFASEAQPNTLFVVARFGASISIRYLFDGITSTDRHALFLNAFSQAEAYAGVSVIDGGSFTGEVAVYAVSFDSTATEIFKNGVSVATGNVGGQALTGLTVGGRFNGVETFDGDLPELICYNRALTATERQQVTDYLIAKYAIGGQAAPVPAGQPRRQRPIGSGARRGRFFTAPVAVQAPAAPAVPPAVIGRRRLTLVRRVGRFLSAPIAAPAAPAPPVAPALKRLRVQPAVKARRGRFFPIPPAAPAPAAPALAPAFVHHPRLLVTGVLRRGQFYEPSWQPVVYGTGLAAGVGAAGRPSRQATVIRRGRLFAVPASQVQAQPNVWRPAIIHAGLRLAGRPVRRGRLFEPPWPQGPQSVWRPDPVRAVLRLAGRPTRRGNFHEPPWPQAVAAGGWTPEFRRRRRPFVAVAVRRVRFAAVPPAPAGTPAWLRRQLRPLPSQRARRRYNEPRWVEGPQSVWRPPFRSRPGVRGRFAPKLRRGCQWAPRWPQGQQVPFNVNPVGPDMAGAVTSETDTTAGAMSRPGGMVGGTTSDSTDMAGTTSRPGGMVGEIS